MKWPKAAGDTQFTHALFVVVLACIVGVFLYLVITLVLGANARRGDLACAFVRSQILNDVGRMGSYRGTHPCTATALDDEDRIWAVDGVYRSGLTRDIQPSIPFTGVAVWDGETETFEACVIDFRRGGEGTTDIETIRPEIRPALCPE